MIPLNVITCERFVIERALVRSLFVQAEHHRYADLMARLESRGNLRLVANGRKDVPADEGGATATTKSFEVPPPVVGESDS